MTSIRKDIEKLTNIEVLDLYDNFISEIPISMRHLNKLKSFDMEYNNIDSDIIQEVSIIKYWFYLHYSTNFEMPPKQGIKSKSLYV